jgi:hypothetical protein
MAPTSSADRSRPGGPADQIDAQRRVTTEAAPQEVPAPRPVARHLRVFAEILTSGSRSERLTVARMLRWTVVMKASLGATPTSGRTGQPKRRRETGALRYILGALLTFATLNAFAGGYYGLAGAKGVPREWLRGSPFPDYFVPSLILVVVVGGSLLLATVAVFARWRQDRLFAIAAAAIAFGWLAIEVAIIGYVSWMQPATAIGGALLLVLAWQLPSASPTGFWRRRTA